MQLSSPRPTTTGALVLLVVLGAITALFFRAPIVETDVWWHLATGREIAARGAVPLTDPFSFTFEGKEWISHEWLWDILNWAAYSVHPDAVAWLNVILLLALFAVAFGNSRTLGAPALACGAAVFIAATGAHWFLSIRPLLCTILFVGVVVLTRDRKWAPFLWPALVIVWVNLHGGFIFGIGAIGLLAVVRTVEASLKERRLVVDRRVWIGVALCLLVWMVNPWGWRIAGYPLDYLSDTGYREIGEWHAPDIGIDLRNYEGQFWIAALLAAAGAVLSWKRDAYPAALCSVTFAMAATSRRFIPLFLVMSAPLVAVLLGELQRRATQGVPWLRERSASIVAAIVAVVVAAVLWSGIAVSPDLLGRWSGIDRFPQSALRYLRALGSPERVLNAYDWGGYLILHAPEMKVFFDSRANTVYDEKILQDYTAFIEGKGDLSEMTRRYAPDVALVQPGPVVTALQESSEPWTVVYDDGTAVVLLPPGSPLLDTALPSPEAALPGEAGVEMILASRASATGELEAAVQHLETAIARDPLLVRAYAELARAHLQSGRPVDAGKAIDAGIRAYPRQEKRFRFYEGQAYLESGHLPFALDALRQAYPRGPFGPRKFVAGLIRRTEVQIASGTF